MIASRIFSTTGTTMNAKLFSPILGIPLNLAHVSLSVNTSLLMQMNHPLEPFLTFTWLAGLLVERELSKNTRNFWRSQAGSLSSTI